MVTCKLMGGMGNQMFQIAATIALAFRSDSDYGIPATFSDAKRKIAFGHFPLASERDARFFYREPSFTYNEIPYQDGICIDGYFQSEKYFSDFRKGVIDAFGLSYEKNKGVVSIHIRRGDYMELEQFHPFVSQEYITDSIYHFYAKGYKNFLVFSDDMDWCRKTLSGTNFPLCRFQYSNGKSESDDIRRMSGCEHNIIANSSFSWWGAWLNRNPEKIVIAPKRWFGKSMNHDTKDLIPENWIRL